ncbi:hypothetical protein [Mycolicibacterium goodii]|uniref:hypothetical protein n=1 Tax=Mycolicibacterium goodii TaxID=134601 RepID=UPI001BDD7908|nr:hypothetical protein [Mycolicibacterium goodii]MBU8830844.1 hypothetical protein [Mycolicibacterium goodii]
MDVDHPGLVREIDPLTCDVWDIPARIVDDGCDCRRRLERAPDVRAALRHTDECAVNGIYAELYEELDIGEAHGDLVGAMLMGFAGPHG